jgi:hypothetical protein
MAQMHFVGLYLCIDDNKEIDHDNPQMKDCIFYYNNFVNAYNPIIQARKGIILYYKTNGIIIFSNHVNANHTIIAIFLQEKVNNSKKLFKSNQQNKSLIYLANKFQFILLLYKILYIENDVQQKDFLQDLSLLIIKDHLPMQFVKTIWMKCLALHLCA